MDNALTPLASAPEVVGVFVGTSVIVYPPDRLVPSRRVEFPHQMTLTGGGAIVPLMEPGYLPMTGTVLLGSDPAHPGQ